MSSFNHVTFIGRLGGDPDMRYTQSGKPKASFSLAVDRRRSGDGQSETDWIPIVAWERLAELANEYLRKGSKAHVSGRLQTYSYEKDGEKRKGFEVVANDIQFLDPRDANGGGGQGHQNQGARAPGPRQQQPPGPRGGYQQGGGRQQSGRQVAEQTYGGGYQQHDDLGMDDVPF